MNPKLTQAISPHLARGKSIQKIMWLVIASLMPALFWGFFIFGLPAIKLTLTCILTAIIAEMIVFYLRKRDPLSIKDGSGILTAILLAMVLPPSFPLYLAFLGTLFSIIIGKALFGGLGYNIFNPALIGRAFLQISFPVAMTTWALPKISNFHAVTTATPLAAAKFENIIYSTKNLFLGISGGCIGETSALLLLLGGIFLLITKIIDYKIPLSIFITVIIWVFIYNSFASVAIPGIWFQFFSGGLILGAFFMATDLVTSPITPLGSIIFGIGIGLMVMIIRTFSGLPEGVMFSIIFMNAFVPLINRHTRPRIFGTSKERK